MVTTRLQAQSRACRAKPVRRRAARRKVPSCDTETRIHALEAALAKRIDAAAHKSRFSDGRLGSVEAEATVIAAIKAVLKGRASVFVPPARSWYDVSVRWPECKAPVYFNIKVSVGGRDNAFNKKAVVLSLSALQEADIPNAMSLNKMHDLIIENVRTTRDPYDYHYIYVDKKDGTVIVRSISDIQAWTPNPHNLLQINWAKEKKAPACRRRRRNTQLAPVRDKLFRTLATSVDKYIASCDRILKYSMV